MLGKKIVATLLVAAVAAWAVPGDTVRWASLLITWSVIWVDFRRLSGWTIFPLMLLIVGAMWGAKQWGLYDVTATGLLSIVLLATFCSALAELIIDRVE